MNHHLLDQLFRHVTGDGPAPEDALDVLVGAVSELSSRLNLQRSIVLEQYLGEPDLLAGYVAFYLPRSIHQVSSVLGELVRRPRRVVDVGSGPGSATLAALNHGAERVLALDHAPAALRLLDQLEDTRIETRVVDLETHEIADSIEAIGADTVIASHVLNELWTEAGGTPARARWCMEVLEALPTDGRLVLIDPALRTTSRQLLSLRDEVVARGGAVLAPCLRQSDCPALHDDRDWCHAERQWDPSPLVTAIADRVGIRHDVAKMTYFVFGLGADTTHPDSRYRIVSEPLHTKGRLRYFGCGPADRRSLILKERDADGDAAVFAELQRGDVIEIGKTVEKGDGFVIQSGERVERLARAGESPPGRAADKDS